MQRTDTSVFVGDHVAVTSKNGDVTTIQLKAHAKWGPEELMALEKELQSVRRAIYPNYSETSSTTTVVCGNDLRRAYERGNISSPKRLTGKVKWFNDAKGFGFISSDDESKPEFFVHFTEIQCEGFRSLTEGDRVEFEPTDDKTMGTPRAFKVKKI